MYIKDILHFCSFTFCRSVNNGAVEKLDQQETDLLKLFDSDDCLKNDDKSRMEMKAILTDIRKVALQAWQERKLEIFKKVENIVSIPKLHTINKKVFFSFHFG